jgi:hypothetical protein
MGGQNYPPVLIDAQDLAGFNQIVVQSGQAIEHAASTRG